MKINLRRAALPVCVALGLGAGCAPAATRSEPKDQSLITAEDLEKYPNEPIEKIIERKVPGVEVATTADGSLVLQIRGARTMIMGEPKPPLYVLDGIPLAPNPDGALAGIDPMNIASIKVLKGSDAALYGIDGANGVIVVTTKLAPKR